MPRGVPTPASVRELIVKLRLEEKLSIRAIATQSSDLKVFLVIFWLNMRRMAQAPLVCQVEDLAKPQQETILHWLDCFKTATEIFREVNESLDIRVSRKTVSRRLKEVNLHARTPAVKPLISKKNRNARLAFATQHVLLTDKDWAKVYFSDESKFNKSLSI